MKRVARPKADERTAMGEGTPTNPTKDTLESHTPNFSFSLKGTV